MKKQWFIVLITFSFLGLIACRSGDPISSQEAPIDRAHNARNSLNWPGTYRGVVPGANSSIQVQLRLQADQTYYIEYIYIDKDDTPYTGTGTFVWDDSGSRITLDTGEFPPYYWVGENQLTQLDMAGNFITGDLAELYRLTREAGE